ncbi:MAG: hypothetical protein P1V20_22395 [Verrucomicrobiales bacterium]|nr:hypothetical protein [Verrucomicrobiales bacterium]
MKKIIIAAIAIITVGAASSSFAGGCETSYVTVQQNHCAPTYVVPQPCYKQVVTYPVYNPCHVEKKVIVQQPCYTTYVKPCVQTYKVHTPVYYNYAPSCGYKTTYNSYYTPSCGY